MKTAHTKLIDIIYEHNFLNGLWFVFAEFTLVSIVAFLVGAASFVRASYALSFIGVGIFCNAVTMLVIISAQLRLGEPSKNLLQNRSKEYRSWVKNTYPNLPTHTAILSLALIAPFAIPVVLKLQSK